jgi:hypothetical protein
LQIVAAPGARAPSTPAATKEIAQPEKITENVGEIAE